MPLSSWDITSLGWPELTQVGGMEGKRYRSGRRGNHPSPPSQERLTVALEVAGCLSANTDGLLGERNVYSNPYAHSVSMSRKWFPSPPKLLNPCRNRRTSPSRLYGSDFVIDATPRTGRWRTGKETRDGFSSSPVPCRIAFPPSASPTGGASGSPGRSRSMRFRSPH